ncbi:MAG: hypothetical protein ABEI31_08405 [Halodesulfurarchaeum sp.]
MRIRRDHLTVLLNAFFDRGDETFAIEHPAPELDELVRVELGPHDDCRVRFPTSLEAYAAALEEVRRNHPEAVADDLPSPDQFLKAVLASGILEIENREETRQLLERYGDPDLMAGHPPVFAGFDTNLLPWRIDRVLGLHDPDAGVGYVNGFVLATGVRDELDWDYKCHDTDPFEAAFGDVFEEYWNQPLGSARVGRLGQLTYRRIRDIEQAQEIDSGTGDQAIVEAYDEYNREHRAEILLFSNDRNFVELAQGHRILGQHIAFPDGLPSVSESVSASWGEVELLVSLLAVVFGVIEVPNASVLGVWRGKDQLDWQYERVKVAARSPDLEAMLERDLSIVESYEEVSGG